MDQSITDTIGSPLVRIDGPTAGTVAANKLPAGDRRDRLRHGCAAAIEALPDGELAAAYVEAMERRLPEE